MVYLNAWRTRASQNEKKYDASYKNFLLKSPSYDLVGIGFGFYTYDARNSLGFSPFSSVSFTNNFPARATRVPAKPHDYTFRACLTVSQVHVAQISGQY